MLTHANGGKLIHMTTNGKKTFCDKKVGEMWSVWKEPLSGGEVMSDCPLCGGPAEFEYHREELRQACAVRAEQERQLEAERKQRNAEVRQIRDEFAFDLADLLNKHAIAVTIQPTGWAKKLKIETEYKGISIKVEVVV